MYRNNNITLNHNPYLKNMNFCECCGSAIPNDPDTLKKVVWIQILPVPVRISRCEMPGYVEYKPKIYSRIWRPQSSSHRYNLRSFTTPEYKGIGIRHNNLVLCGKCHAVTENMGIIQGKNIHDVTNIIRNIQI